MKIKDIKGIKDINKNVSFILICLKVGPVFLMIFTEFSREGSLSWRICTLARNLMTSCSRTPLPLANLPLAPPPYLK
jgi:hypothetical protein